MQLANWVLESLGQPIISKKKNVGSNFSKLVPSGRSWKIRDVCFVFPIEGLGVLHYTQ